MVSIAKFVSSSRLQAEVLTLGQSSGRPSKCQFHRRGASGSLSNVKHQVGLFFFSVEGSLSHLSAIPLTSAVELRIYCTSSTAQGGGGSFQFKLTLINLKKN